MGDQSISFDLDMQLDVYQGTFDPSDTSANFVANGDDNDGFDLLAGETYLLVVRPLSSGDSGDWSFAFDAGFAAQLGGQTSAIGVPTLHWGGIFGLIIGLLGIGAVRLRRELI